MCANRIRASALLSEITGSASGVHYSTLLVGGEPVVPPARERGAVNTDPRAQRAELYGAGAASELDTNDSSGRMKTLNQTADGSWGRDSVHPVPGNAKASMVLKRRKFPLGAE